ncbi:non-canonical purine NTP pyrophosphatase [Vitiosangium sp. GDMCC 1.1324]|uniref:non-canonical purine NTP pyrophosphatase n=1 Tax=Vitiosangium sp. (strain GDMCC 1.1324) TaxID=2138576 RepID=UPI00130DD723|nr:non-canonical purine NTP pyrophosphatase [Vitiosangium sp. GDMCC 1.1324]
MKIAWYNTTNPDKVREVEHFFGPTSKLGILRSAVTEVLDANLEKVILAKAAAAYQVCRVPVVVEHGAFCLDALGGMPGALIKPLWETLQFRICDLVPAGQSRTMFARSAVCYCDGRTRTLILKEVKGELATKARGSGGFHWDPIFIPEGHTRTFAEMSLTEKLALSPAGLAYAELRQRLSL